MQQLLLDRAPRCSYLHQRSFRANSFDTNAEHLKIRHYSNYSMSVYRTWIYLPLEVYCGWTRFIYIEWIYIVFFVDLIWNKYLFKWFLCLFKHIQYWIKNKFLEKFYRDFIILLWFLNTYIFRYRFYSNVIFDKKMQFLINNMYFVFNLEFLTLCTMHNDRWDSPCFCHSIAQILNFVSTNI